MSVTRVGTKADVDPVLCTIYLACHVHSGSVRSKSLVDSGVCAQAWASWLIMSGEPPQAGNGAGKSRRRRQWKDCRPVARQVSTVGGDPRGPFLLVRIPHGSITGLVLVRIPFWHPGSYPVSPPARLFIGRLWCRGYHVWFPTMRPGFESRLAHHFTQRGPRWPSGLRRST